MKKKAAALAIAAIMASGIFTETTGAGQITANNRVKEKVFVGVCMYAFDDIFLAGVRTNMAKQAFAVNARLDIIESQNKQITQKEQVDAFIKKGVNALAITPVYLFDVEAFIEKAKAESLPIVFLNRQPQETDMQSYDKVWFVGVKAEQSGQMSGEIIADY